MKVSQIITLIILLLFAQSSVVYSSIINNRYSMKKTRVYQS